MAMLQLIQETHVHLEEVNSDPSKQLNEKLLESIDRQVTGQGEIVTENQRDDLLNQLSALLPTLQQDPTPITKLIQILISSSHPYDFSRVLSIQPAVDFVAGLRSPHTQINITVLALLEKAKYHKSDIGIIAGEPGIVGALIRLWLCTSDTAVASRAHEVLLVLLQADVQGILTGQGAAIVEEGLLWRRIFRDKDIYGSLFSICSLQTAGQEEQPSKRDKTVAQARMLDMILCIDSEPVRASQIRDVEATYGVKQGDGILQFAASQMVDYQDDVLMHMTLIDFYAKYLSMKHAAIRMIGHQNDNELSSSYALRFLQDSGIHSRTISYYLDPDAHDALDLAYLYGPSANYLATYTSVYAQHALRQEHVLASILTRLTKVLERISPGQWAHGQAPKHDLHVMASLPRLALIPKNRDSPLFLIPPNSRGADTYSLLAHIFHGSGEVTDEEDEAASRTLYFLYEQRHPDFWKSIISTADTVAMKDAAIAAIGLIGAVITARWKPLPDHPSLNSSASALPAESWLAEQCQIENVKLPQSGIETIMSEPAIRTVVPFLMKPAQTFSNLVGGGRGDVESAAYRVAVAKHDALILLHQKLQEWVGTHSDAQEMVAAVGRRVAQGPMGGTSEVGGRVGTLEL
ncbi:hypothetical protein ACLMJK_002880 [Lecanora helva]